MTSYYYITGTSRGIGLALAQELLSDESAHVIGIGRTPGPSHRNYRHVALDLEGLDAVASFVFPEHADADRIVLVNNAGTLTPRRLGSEDAASIIRTYAINAIAPVMLMNAFIAAYREQSCRRVICNLTSVAATRAVHGAALYCGSKAALDMTSRVVALELGTDNEGLRVFTVDPGSVDTGMQETLRNADEQDFPGAPRNRQFKEDGLLGDPQVIAQRLAQLLRQPGLVTGDSVRLGEAAISRRNLIAEHEGPS
jgi:benzil reductase ((S)-benzoin forming)